MMRNTSKTSKDATAVGFLGPHGSRGVQFDSDSAEFGGSNSFNEQNSSTISSDIKCGDMQPIAREFRQHYEKKLKEAAADNSGDGVQVKMKLQEDWIRDLTEQNDMLIRAVLELETEATERVKMLEEKLKESAACACEVMDGWRGREQTQAQLSSDVHNLLQLIQRARTSNSPSGDSSTASLTAGLHFYHVTERDLATALQPSVTQSTEQTDEAREAANMKHKEILEIQQNALIFGEGSLDESDQFRQMKENYSTLKQAMQDVRDALTSEVADKHDAILALRRDVQTLEERCRRADQQTHFKDDIIKELRKDLKHLKLEIQDNKSNRTITSNINTTSPNQVPYITYIPMTTTRSSRITNTTELQCSARHEVSRDNLTPPRRHHHRRRHTIPDRDTSYRPPNNDKEQKGNFTIVHEHPKRQVHESVILQYVDLPQQALNKSSSILPTSCFGDDCVSHPQRRRSIYTKIQDAVDPARDIVDYLDLTVNEGKILSQAKRIMRRRQHSIFEESGDCDQF